MVRGDVVLVELPRPLGSSGHEQFGRRPAIIVQDNAATASLSTVVVVPLTTTLKAAAFSGSFLLTPSRTNGLDETSVVLTHQIGALDKRRIARKIGKLASRDLELLETNLRRLLGL
jgi:mRNA-degrading endonuclease toxin of MazEF toxin-antitoxin module